MILVRRRDRTLKAKRENVMRNKITFFRAKNWHIHQKRISCRVIDRKKKKFNVLQKHIDANQKVTCETIPLIMFDASCFKHHFHQNEGEDGR